MITGELKSKVDRVWDAFWSGGISNPLEVTEQITYLLFIKRLDEIQTRKDEQANRSGKPDPNPFFTEDQQELRWHNLKARDSEVMYGIVEQGVFPYLRTMGGDDSTYSHHMRDARFTIPTPNLLAKVVDLVDTISIEPGGNGGDIYEYMLAKFATVGQNGQFRTPRHIIDLMVEMTRPKPDDDVCDPACGTAGFLVQTASYVKREHAKALLDAEQQAHFHTSMFHGFDFDSTMLRIGSMNMLLHGIGNPDIRYRDSLAEPAAGESERYSLILANPPFAGSLDYESTAADLLRLVKTKKTELLFLALSLRILKPGGRAAIIVPDGVLFGSTKAHKELRRMLVEDHKLDGVVKLPSGVFKPYAGVSTAILLFTRTDTGGTDNVWFYDVQADGFSLDDKRNPLLPEDRQGVRPAAGSLSEKEHTKNNLPDALSRWFNRGGSECSRARSEQSFCVPKSDIVAQGYDLSLNRYAERPRYLTAGRRVTMADLMGTGLLAEGMQLAFERAGANYSARVTAEGWLELAGGQQFPSPNRAAAAAVGEGTIDGWQAWALEDGTTLDQLRQQFLNTPAVGIPSPDVAELANHRLAASPNLAAALPSVTVQKNCATRHPESTEDAQQIQSINEPARDEDEDAPVVGLTVGDLPSALGGVVFVSPSATFDEAITRMVINDYSQLPVLSGRNLRGAVTWQSIARARHANNNPPFPRAIVQAREVSYNQDLIDILPILAEFEFVLVRNQSNEIAGIITASDVAAAYGAMATPFFLIGELDKRLRQVLASSIEFPEVQVLCDPEGNRSIKGFNDLSIGDYQRVLENKEAWEKVGWSLDRKIFIERLDEIRQIRNDLMHFNPEPLPHNSTHKIRHMINVLREYGN
ncbi:N-6 DNA methylase [Streptomyces sp. NRRL S-340]|uniref:N-6 DNA methylase n=1 Tax=Streptomyces sp. NRRL S-340 TaxID=1463901 RepID=UPI000ABC3B64|nr:N-6 DNA methylase [Streptomyces sp. NRRL S-340]